MPQAHDPRAEMLANRVRKVARHRRRWARRADVECYRLYDRDIPEIPLVIDWYAGRLYIAEVVRDDVPLADVGPLGAAVADALGVARDAVFYKRRERQRGATQYERLDGARERFVVEEGGLRFWVNLTDYLDTGLFLDHRQTRRLVAEASPGKHVLNLFAYTGSFSVYAAVAGASSTTTVDLSHTYLDWAADNLALNDIPPEGNAVVHADVRPWLVEAAREGRRYDLIVLDPPTFSNSKRMQGTWVVQRDHVALLREALAVTAPGGVIYFSSNARSFRLDTEALADVDITEITTKTVPPDFDRRRPHRCWTLVPR